MRAMPPFALVGRNWCAGSSPHQLRGGVAYISVLKSIPLGGGHEGRG